ncbi:hypothetical protein [Humisphaera borealis]|uniref:DUF5666 domain-containing protein n=1 Tax=Humisphaera borealis TaxID=2807512 RepID=A0A7M2WUV0_9BACT|nr:hypothetical protein [Humisphaera borealis]QOV89183.1 hypothetical protein IPV69_23700 [Humisphaera borealis]
MRHVLMALAAFALVGLIGASNVQAAKKADKGSTEGVIESITGTAPALTLSVKGAGKKAVAVSLTTTEKTSVTVDGQAKTLTDLKAGAHVKYTASGGVVSTIDATAAAAPKKKKKAA